jgi:hypothetical protein
MKEQRTTPIPQTEYMTPAGPYRFYYNHTTTQNEQDEQLMHEAEFVEVDEIARDKVVAALVRRKYSINDEAAILRKKLSGEEGSTAAFEAYNIYVNECKSISV